MILTICVAAGVPLYAQEGTDEPTEEAAPQADTPEERVLEEIVVTAQKHVEWAVNRLEFKGLEFGNGTRDIGEMQFSVTS